MAARLPFRSSRLWIDESLLTRMATPPRLCRPTAITLIGAPNAPRNSAGASPSSPTSRLPTLSASATGDPAVNCFHSRV
ncbi:hypothetical protein D3C85_1643080 [compost metagenome]